MDDPFKLVYDERREIWRLLDRLPGGDAARLDFLRWACTAADPKNPLRATVKDNSGRTNEVYNDLMLLAWQHGLSLMVAGEELVRRVRRMPIKARSMVRA